MSNSTLIRRLTGAALCTIIFATLTAQAPSSIEQRIHRIQDALPPAVMVKGEPASMMKLADRMAALRR